MIEKKTKDEKMTDAIAYAAVAGAFVGLAAHWGLLWWQLAVLFWLAVAIGFAHGQDVGIKAAINYFKGQR